MNLDQLIQELQDKLRAIELVKQLLRERTKHEQVKKALHWTQDPKNRKKMMATIKKMQKGKEK
jgi:hypothetical protein